MFCDAFARQGFASRELVTRWAEIAGPDVAAHSEPLKIQSRVRLRGSRQETATLILRVEGPMALEIQHASDAVLERVNRFFGWSAVGELALRQAPLSRRDRPKASREPDPAAVAKVAETLGSVEDEQLRAALAHSSARRSSGIDVFEPGARSGNPGPPLPDCRFRLAISHSFAA